MTEIPAYMFLYRGRSMWPCFQEGDLLEYTPCAIKHIKAGDCIVFGTEDDRYVTHRVIAAGDNLTTRGDALSAPDREPVSGSQLLGKVIFRYRLGRKSAVSGGVSGSLAALFYRYAGRIDPLRNGRGGTIARCLQFLSMKSLGFLWNKGIARRIRRDDGKAICFWTLLGKNVARQDEGSYRWTVAWPLSILLRIPDEY